MCISLRPNRHDDFLADPRCLNADTAVLHELVGAVEDWILEVLTEFVLAQPTTHLSLHKEQFLVDEQRFGLQPEFTKLASQAVLQRSQYHITIQVKENLTVFDVIAKHADFTTVCTEERQPILTKEGN